MSHEHEHEHEHEHAPVIVQLVSMRDSADCAIASLAMLLGKTYAEVLAACRGSNITQEGLSNYQFRAVARRLGYKLRYQRGAPDDDDIGALDLTRADDDIRHVVLYLRGVVVDPRGAGELWSDVDAYVRDRGWNIDGLWIRQEALR